MVVLTAEVVLRLASVSVARRVCHGLTIGARSVDVSTLTWAIECAGRWVPSRCLARAIALQSLLSRSGYASLVEIGVDNRGQRLQAHAWVRWQGKVILGGPDVSEFDSLAVLD